MESTIGAILSIFYSQLITILFVVLCVLGLISWWIKHFLDKRKIHNRLMEIAFERGMMNEKSRMIQH